MGLFVKYVLKLKRVKGCRSLQKLMYVKKTIKDKKEGVQNAKIDKTSFMNAPYVHYDFMIIKSIFVLLPKCENTF